MRNIDELVWCPKCTSDFRIDKSTGMNLDLDNVSPVCPSCKFTQYEDIEKLFEKPVDKSKIRDTISKDKTKFED